jgi:hypothetical protein
LSHLAIASRSGDAVVLEVLSIIIQSFVLRDGTDEMIVNLYMINLARSTEIYSAAGHGIVPARVSLFRAVHNNDVVEAYK